MDLATTPPKTKEGGGGIAGSNMRRLLEDLHSTRMRLEQNQKGYEATKRSIDELDKEISKLKIESDSVNKTCMELNELVATNRTELSCLEIRSQVLDQILEKAEEEQMKTFSELHKIKMEASHVSSNYLRTSIQFGMQWNGSELGSKNRKRYREAEMERLDQNKHQLESELSDFLRLFKGIKEAAKEVEELEKKAKEQNGQVNTQAEGVEKQIATLEASLKDLEREESEFLLASKVERERIQNEIQKVQHTIDTLGKKGNNTNAAIKTQTQSILKTQVPNQKSQHQSFNREFQKSMGSVNQLEKRKEDEKNKGHFKSQVSANLQSEREVPMSNLTQQKSFDNEGFGDDFSSSNDEELLLAAATEFSQSIRSYEPMNPAPIYVPPPAKIRLMDRQAPITSFMKQVSSTKAIRKPPRSTQSQGKSGKKNAKVNHTPKISKAPPAPAPVASSGKSFQFKKKSKTHDEMGNPSANSTGYSSMLHDSSNFGDDSYNTSLFPPTFTDFQFDQAHDAEFEIDAGKTAKESVYDRPYAQICSSRMLLTESQEEKLLGN